MMVLFLLLVVASAALAAVHWRAGLLAMIVVGVLQDPVRKMIPGIPGYLVLSAAVVWGAAVLGAVFRRDVEWADFRRRYRGLSAAIVVFAVLLVPAAIRSVAYSPGSWQIAVVGGTVYGSLLLGMVVGTFYPRRGADLRRLLACYCAVTALAMSGVVMEKLGYKHLSIGSSAMGHTWVTYRMGSTPVRMLSGFFRSPDVQGWHAAMLVMLAAVLAVDARGWFRLAWLAACAAGNVGVLLCGRRKMVSMLPVFIVVYLVLHVLHGRGRRLGLILTVVLIVAAAGVQSYRMLGADETTIVFYGTAVDTARRDIRDQGIGSVFVTYKQAGFFGHGLGMATQGTQHIAADRPRVWQESGPSKLMAELGVPGFLGFLILGAALLRTMVSDLRWVSASSLHPLFAGVTATVLANGAAAVVSAQIFGDPFVAAFLSLLIGIVLSASRLRGRASDRVGAQAPAMPWAAGQPVGSGSG